MCDAEKLFIHCYVGQAGSVHDALVFKRSDFYQKMISGTYKFVPGSHILGDNAYPISMQVMTPYPRTNATQRQKNFNKKLSSCRVKIEQAFGLLRGRFRRLKYMDNARVELVSVMVLAACVLHNLCILENDWEWVNPDMPEKRKRVNSRGEEESDEEDDEPPPDYSNSRTVRSAGQLKRDSIALSVG
jgi:hypothetical protein